eukprot:UN18083
MCWGNLSLLIIFSLVVTEYTPSLLCEHLRDHHYSHVPSPILFLLGVIKETQFRLKHL